MTTDTLRAIGWMVLSMAAFAVNYFFIKQVTEAFFTAASCQETKSR